MSEPPFSEKSDQPAKPRERDGVAESAARLTELLGRPLGAGTAPQVAVERPRDRAPPPEPRGPPTPKDAKALDLPVTSSAALTKPIETSLPKPPSEAATPRAALAASPDPPPHAAPADAPPAAPAIAGAPEAAARVVTAKEPVVPANEGGREAAARVVTAREPIVPGSEGQHEATARAVTAKEPVVPASEGGREAAARVVTAKEPIVPAREGESDVPAATALAVGPGPEGKPDAPAAAGAVEAPAAPAPPELPQQSDAAAAALRSDQVEPVPDATAREVTERPDPEAARVIARVRRLMLITIGCTFMAVAGVLALIGYRVFDRAGRGEAPINATLTLPKGASIIQTAVAEDRIVVTLKLNGAIEIRTYDLKTLRPVGRLSFASVP